MYEKQGINLQYHKIKLNNIIEKLTKSSKRTVTKFKMVGQN